MGKRKSLVFVDDGALKVVFGSSLKVIKPADVAQPYNIQFFDKLFAESDVVVLTSAEIISREKFDAYAAVLEGPAEVEAPAAQAPTPKRGVVPPKPRRMTPDEIVSSGVFIRSNAKTTIVVDDLFTNAEIAPGVKKALAVLPDLAVNLSTLDQDQVRKSSILRRLIDNGTFVACSAKDALKMEEVRERKIADEEDSRLDQWAPIVDSHRRALDKEDDRSRIGRIADPIDITEDVQRPGIAAASSNEDSGLMSNLMDMLDQAPPDEGMLSSRPESMGNLMSEIEASDRDASMETPPRRQLAARPARGDVDPDRAARPIGRRME